MNSPVLIIDDLADDAHWLQRQLAEVGLCNPCHSVSSAAEALAYLKGIGKYADRHEYPFPMVVLLDLKMPEIDGFEFLEQINPMPERDAMLVVAVSAMDDLGSIRRAYQLGANSFLCKPCEKGDLQRLIQGFPRYWSRTPPPMAMP